MNPFETVLYRHYQVPYFGAAEGQPKNGLIYYGDHAPAVLLLSVLADAYTEGFSGGNAFHWVLDYLENNYGPNTYIGKLRQDWQQKMRE